MELSLGHGHGFIFEDVLNRVQQLDSFLHGFLECLPPGNEPHPACSLIDDGGSNCVGQIVLAGCAARVDEPNPPHVAVDDLVASPVNRVIGRELFVNQRMGLAEFEDLISAIRRRLLLFDNIRLDRCPKMVRLAGQIRRGMIIYALLLEGRVPKITPQDCHHPELMGMLEHLGDVDDLPRRLVGTK